MSRQITKVLVFLILLSFFNIHYPVNLFWSSQFHPVVYLLSVSFFFCWIIFIIWRNKLSLPKWNIIDGSVALYLLYTSISGFLFSRNILTDEGWIPLGHIIWYVGLRLSLETVCSFSSFSKTISIVLGVNLAVSFFQFFKLLPIDNPIFPFTGLFSNPGPLGGFILLCLPFVFYCCRRSGGRYKLPYAVLLITGIAGLMASGSRAAVLAFVISLAALAIKERAVPVNRIYWILPCLLIILTVFLYKFNPYSADGRMLIWKISARMFGETPVFGAGSGGFKAQYNLYQASYFSEHVSTPRERMLADQVYTPFNTYIRIVLETGAIGLLLFSGMVYFFFSSFGTDFRHPADNLLQALMVAFLVFAFFSYPLETFPINGLFLLVFAIRASYARGWTEQQKRIPLRTFRWLLSMSFVLLGVSLTKWTVISRWKEAQYLLKYNPATGIKLYHACYPLLKSNPAFIFNYGAELANLGLYREAIPLLEETKHLYNSVFLYSQLFRCYHETGHQEKAEDSLLTACNMVPGMLRPKLLLMNFYIKQNENKKAKKTAEEILNTPVKIPTTQANDIKQQAKHFLKNNRRWGKSG